MGCLCFRRPPLLLFLSLFSFSFYFHLFSSYRLSFFFLFLSPPPPLPLPPSLAPPHTRTCIRIAVIPSIGMPWPSTSRFESRAKNLRQQRDRLRGNSPQVQFPRGLKGRPGWKRGIKTSINHGLAGRLSAPCCCSPPRPLPGRDPLRSSLISGRPHTPSRSDSGCPAA